MSQAVPFLRCQHGSEPSWSAEDHCSTHRHSLKRGAGLRKDEVVPAKLPFGISQHLSSVQAGNIQFNPCLAAGGPYDRERSVRAKGIAEREGALRSRRQGRPRAEALRVDEIQMHVNLLVWNSLLEDQPVTANMIDSNIAHNTREQERLLLPRSPAMTEVERWDRWKSEDGHQRFEVMLSVDDVRRCGETRKIVDYRNGGGT